MSDTPTPRTDEQINGKPCTRFGLLAGMSLRDALVPSEFARQLERELAALRLDNLTAHKMACAAGIERDTLRAELERLKQVGNAVVERWETPSWKDVEPTAHIIYALRDELAAHQEESK